MNSKILYKALEKIGNSKILINLISIRAKEIKSLNNNEQNIKNVEEIVLNEIINNKINYKL